MLSEGHFQFIHDLGQPNFLTSKPGSSIYLGSPSCWRIRRRRFLKNFAVFNCNQRTQIMSKSERNVILIKSIAKESFFAWYIYEAKKGKHTM